MMNISLLIKKGDESNFNNPEFNTAITDVKVSKRKSKLLRVWIHLDICWQMKIHFEILKKNK